MIPVYKYLIAHCKKGKDSTENSQGATMSGPVDFSPVLGGNAVILSAAIRRGNIIQSDAIKWT